MNENPTNEQPTKSFAQVEQESLRELIGMIQAIQFPDQQHALAQVVMQCFTTQAHVMALDALLLTTGLTLEQISAEKKKQFDIAREKIFQMTRSAPKIQVASSVNGRH